MEMVSPEIIDGIMKREGGWSDQPPDPPTRYGASLPEWIRYCIATHQTWRGTKANLRMASPDDIRAFYAWYFEDIGIDKMDIPTSCFEHVLDMLTTTSKGGVIWIIGDACRVMGVRDLTMAVVSNRPEVVAAILAFSRITYLSNLAEMDASKRKWVRGWVKRAVAMGKKPFQPQEPQVTET